MTWLVLFLPLVVFVFLAEANHYWYWKLSKKERKRLVEQDKADFQAW